jgi:hypothetical protein
MAEQECMDFEGYGINSREEGERMARRIEWVQIMGVRIPAHKLICPECKTLDLNTGTDEKWNAHCPLGHTWKVRDIKPSGRGMG